MPAAKRTITIDRSAEDVFAFFADPANDRRWRSHVKEIASNGPAGVGSTIHQVVEGPGGRGILADIEVTAYDRPTRYAFRVTTGPARPIGSFDIRPSGTGSEVTFSLGAELGGLKKLFMGSTVQRAMDGEMEGLDTAKRLIEGG
jgi:carbon monoxide dehydrogenase subunit G